MRKYRKDRETERAKDSANFSLEQIQVQRDVRSLVEELAAACREIYQLCGEISSVRIQTDRPERESKSLMEVLERGGLSPSEEEGSH